MSSRQLRKLRHRSAEEDTEDTGEIGFLLPAPSKPRHFASLAVLQDDNGVDDKIDEDSDNHDLGVPEKVGTSITTSKRRKKSKKKQKPQSKVESSNNPGVLNHQPEDQLDEIDAAILELNLKGGEHNTAPIISHQLDLEYERVCALLCINSQRLKVANEIRNLFGQSSAGSYDDVGSQTPRGSRRRQRGPQQQLDLETALKGRHAPGKGLPELTLRRNLFIQGKDEWPRGTTGGLGMEVVNDRESVDGTVEFRFSHSHAYAVVQGVFLTLVEMGDPQNLIEHLIENPYNISLLLQVSKIAKDQGDHSLSSDLIERALFSFARATISLFANKLSQGKARLDFSRPENREFYLAGWQYIKSLQMKGTYRTALEWAKLLLSMNPEQDPYCMILMIQHLSLRAFEAQYLLEIKETIMPKINNTFVTSYITPSFALAALQLKDGALARSFLRHSIQHLPWLFCRLFQDLNLDVTPPSIWGFAPRTDAENLLSELYVCQTKDLWNTPEATSLLTEVAHATERLQEAMIPKIQDSEITLDIARFIYLDNTPTLMALVPSKLLHRTPNSESDPLPPDSNTFSYESQRRPWLLSGRESAFSNYLADHFNPLAALRDFLLGGPPSVEDERVHVELNEAIEQNIGEVLAAVAQSPEGVFPRQLRNIHNFLFGARSQAPEAEAMNTNQSVQENSGSDDGGEHYEDSAD